MTTKELIAALAEANVFDEMENDDATIAVCCDNNLMLEIPKDATNWLEVYNPAVQLWKNCSAVKRFCISLAIDEYLGTPLEDREEKPKYRVRLRGFNSSNGHQYLSTDRQDVKTAKFFACAERIDLKQEFTQEELDTIANRNQFKGVGWLQDLIRHAEPVEESND